jgi:hypothetical protein
VYDYIGVVSAVSQYMVYNCVYCCDTCYIPDASSTRKGNSTFGVKWGSSGAGAGEGAGGVVGAVVVGVGVVVDVVVVAAGASAGAGTACTVSAAAGTAAAAINFGVSPARRAIIQWASRWCTATKGLPYSSASACPLRRPTRRHISSPGPFVTAIASTSEIEDRPACDSASATAMSILDLWASIARLGTIPPNCVFVCVYVVCYICYVL